MFSYERFCAASECQLWMVVNLEVIVFRVGSIILCGRFIEFSE